MVRVTLSEALDGCIEPMRERQAKNPTPLVKGYIAGYEACVEVVRKLEADGNIVYPFGDES